MAYCSNIASTSRCATERHQTNLVRVKLRVTTSEV